MKVRSDEWLEDTELNHFPIVEEHVYGTMDLRVFLQDEIWVDIAGTVHQLEDMSHDYLFNVMKMLFTDMEQHHDALLEWYAVGVMIFMAGIVNPTEKQRLEFLSDASETIEHKAAEWLSSTPLMIRIDKLLS
jgi:hypothetical protein